MLQTPKKTRRIKPAWSWILYTTSKFYQLVSLSIPPPPKPIFRFWRRGILKFFTGLFLKGGVFSRKFSEKTQNAAAPAAGFSSLCLQRKHFSKGRLSYVVLRHDSVTLAYPYIFLSFIMVYIHKMCKNIFTPKIVLFTGKKYITGVWEVTVGRTPPGGGGVRVKKSNGL